VHVGILGGGNISGTHARAAVAAGCTVAAVWGHNAGKAGAIAREYSAPAYSDLDTFLAHRPMDIVAIGSPSGLHATHISAAARHRLHVLVEKPLDISVLRVDEAIGQARQAGVRLGVFFQDRLKPDLRRVDELIRDGRLGRLFLASARVKWYRPAEYYRDSRWRGTRALDGGGALMNQGIHSVDALLWLLGPIASVSARTITGLHDIEVEDTVVATLEFASGVVATFEATTAAYPGYPRRLEITGTEGTLIIEGDTLVAADLRAEASRRDTRGEALRVEASAATVSQASPVITDVSAHRRVFEDFLEAIRSGREPACGGEEGRRSVAVVEAIYQSARSGAAPVAFANRSVEGSS
jgi:UDP-N-acetyl-2-amino-2-deoxyglucuronate dehydrogenase